MTSKKKKYFSSINDLPINAVCLYALRAKGLKRPLALSREFLARPKFYKEFLRIYGENYYTLLNYIMDYLNG